jgi:hypothetical protein
LYKIERHDHIEEIKRLKESVREIEALAKDLKEERDRLKADKST